MSDDAEEYFYEWYNGIIDAVNAIEDDANVESRKMKLNGHVARLALLFQVMKWATDSGDMQYIEWDSVESAIRMIDYYEENIQEDPGNHCHKQYRRNEGSLAFPIGR